MNHFNHNLHFYETEANLGLAGERREPGMEDWGTASTCRQGACPDRHHLSGHLKTFQLDEARDEEMEITPLWSQS